MDAMMDQIQRVLPALLNFVFPGAPQLLHLLIDLVVKTRKIYAVGVTLWVVALVPRARQYVVKIAASSLLRSDLAIFRHDETYDTLVAYMTSTKLTELARSLVVSTRVSHGAVSPDSFQSSTPKELHFYPWNDDFIFWYRRQPFRFRCHSDGWGRQNVILSGISTNALRHFIEECRELYESKISRRILCYQPYHGHWSMSRTTAIRPLSTVVMSEKAKKILLEDIQEFLDPKTQDWYIARGISYRRGYIFHGPPGTGKSSLSLAIASEFDLDIYILDLALIDDENLRNLFATLPSRCIVLLEDIDAFSTSRTPSETKESLVSEPKGPSLSTLLNAIDGIGSSEGRILIMTTNHKAKLDRALLRPGRTDMPVFMGLCDSLMLTQLFENMFKPVEIGADEDQQDKVRKAAKIFASDIPADTVSPASVTSLLLSHKDMPLVDEACVKGLAQELLDQVNGEPEVN